jgi:hypothetical protein
MAKKRKKDVRGLAKKTIRENQKESGFFDGRFVERTEQPKNKFNRNQKHSGGKNDPEAYED